MRIPKGRIRNYGQVQIELVRGLILQRKPLDEIRKKEKLF